MIWWYWLLLLRWTNGLAVCYNNNNFKEKKSTHTSYKAEILKLSTHHMQWSCEYMRVCITFNSYFSLLSVSFPACLSSPVAQRFLPLKRGKSSSICSTGRPKCNMSPSAHHPPLTMAMVLQHWVKYHITLSDPQLSQSKHWNVIGPLKVTWFTLGTQWVFVSGVASESHWRENAKWPFTFRVKEHSIKQHHCWQFCITDTNWAVK